MDESGRGDIVLFAWINSAWVEVGRVPAGEVLGEGSNRYTVRAGGLAAGGAYAFKIVDEAGHVHYTDGPVAVQAINISLVRLDMEAMTLSFNTEYGSSYQVLVSTDCASWTNECASCMTAGGWAPFTGAPFMAGPGSSTSVRVPVNGRRQAFFKIVKVAP